MATKKKKGSGKGKSFNPQQQAAAGQIKSADQKKPTPVPGKIKTADGKVVPFVFTKQNYVLLLVGLAFILVGFLLMVGGGSDDPNVFNKDIFSFRRITLAPILVIIGYVIEIFAIMKKPKEKITSV